MDLVDQGIEAESATGNLITYQAQAGPKASREDIWSHVYKERNTYFADFLVSEDRALLTLNSACQRPLTATCTEAGNALGI